MIDQLKAKAAFEAYLEKANNDNRIIGIILAGSRSKGVSSVNSDYDVILVATDESFESVKDDYPKTKYIDSLPHPISEFRERAKIGTRTQYDKYTFTYNIALTDKTGEIQELINNKGTLTLEEARKIANDALGGYLNSLHRSFKCLRNEKLFAAQLHTIDTISRLLTFIFAIEGRVKPFNDLLEWELANHPLTKLPISSKELLNKIKIIIKSADFDTQKELLQIVKQLALDNGYDEEIADWEGYYFG